MPVKNTREEWGSVSKLLHWLVVVLVLVMATIGLTMGDLPNGPDAPGTLSVRANEATTRAGAQVDENAGYTDTFNMTPVEACKQ